jgi:hypothetical protein
MLIGSYIVKGDGGTQYSPSFPRGGLSATFRVQTTQRVGGTPSLTIVVEHKNAEDTAFTTAGTFSAITATGYAVYSLDVSALKEEIRLSYAITATNAWEGFLLNVLAPVWRPYT